MARFDPWNVFLKREWNRNWPFLVGFAITGALVTKFTASLTEEDAKKLLSCRGTEVSFWMLELAAELRVMVGLGQSWERTLPLHVLSLEALLFSFPCP